MAVRVRLIVGSGYHQGQEYYCGSSADDLGRHSVCGARLGAGAGPPAVD